MPEKKGEEKEGAGKGFRPNFFQSAQKLIKNYLRSTMSQERLNSLAILAIECELAKQVDFKDIIKDFASRKIRKMTV